MYAKAAKIIFTPASKKQTRSGGSSAATRRASDQGLQYIISCYSTY